MKLLLILLLSVALASAQTTYPPGVNLMINNGIIDKFRDIIIPDIMEQFKVIRPADIDHSHSVYEIKIYDMEADIVPLRGDQVEITMDETDNTLYARVTDFEMYFNAKAYGRALFVHAHGDARIHAKVDAFSFKIEPLIKVDGDLNDLDYKVDSIEVDLSNGDIHLDHLSIGILPSWLLAPIGNLILDSCTAAYRLFEQQIDGLIVEILNKNKEQIPNHIDIPNTGMTMSLSFPNVPRLSHDQIRVPFDGTIFLTSEGYHPSADPAPEMPDYNPDNPNNIQVFLSQHVLKTTIDTVKRSGMVYTVNADTLAPFGLPDNLMTVRYHSMLFPELACHYTSDVLMTVDLGVDTTLNTEVTFAPNKMHGEFSPRITLKANSDVALTISLRAIFEATVNFEVRDKVTFVTGSLDTLDIADFTFEKGVVQDTDLGEIIQIFKGLVVPFLIKTANGFLSTGITIPVLPLIQDVFEIDLEDIELLLKDKYLEASFTLDIHQKAKMIKDFLKLYA